MSAPEIQEDRRNITNDLKYFPIEVIKQRLAERRRPFALLLLNIERDPNVGGLVRTANHFNAQEVFYYGRKKYNRVAALGTYHYTAVRHFADPEALVEATKEYTWVGIEQKPEAVPIHRYQWPDKPLIVLGHENVGLDISPEILYHCRELVSIPTLGSVRSLNVGVAGGIAVFDFLSKEGYFDNHPWNGMNTRL